MSCLKEKIRDFKNKNLIIDLIFEKKSYFCAFENEMNL